MTLLGVIQVYLLAGLIVACVTHFGLMAAMSDAELLGLARKNEVGDFFANRWVISALVTALWLLLVLDLLLSKRGVDKGQ